MNAEGEVCLVTAFYDINRSDWTAFQRTAQEYIRWFSVLYTIQVPLIVFIDERYYDDVFAICQERPSTTLISINEAFLNENIASWQYIPIEREIMESERYKELVKHRGPVPETLYPEYNCINHAKVDFVFYAILTSDFKFYGWIDFGYTRDDPSTLPLNLTPKFTELKKWKNCVNFIYNHEVIKEDADPFFTLTQARETITGPFWLGSKSSIPLYRELYHEKLRYLHKIGIADDDQAVMVHCYLSEGKGGDIMYIRKNTLLETRGWFTALLLFQD